MMNICSRIDEVIELFKETVDGVFQYLQKVATFTRKAMSLMINSAVGNSDWFHTELNHFRLLLQIEFH